MTVSVLAQPDLPLGGDRLGRLRTLRYGDLFCGGGGSAAGARTAIARLNRMVDVLDARDPANASRRERFAFDLAVAINHNRESVLTHQAAHPEAHDRHFLSDVDDIDVNRDIPEDLDLLWASPSCRFHSDAGKGNRRDPHGALDRATAWHIVKVATRRRPVRIIVENVRAFVRWTELEARRGRKVLGKVGAEYARWVQALKDAGYIFECRLINSADYGLPQSRLRWYAQFRRDGKPIVWPTPTHDRYGRNGRRTWRGAQDVIDPRFALKSFYLRPASEKPLASATIARIAEGVRRYAVPQLAALLGTDVAGPIEASFVVPLRKNSIAKTLDQPIPAITASSGNQFYFARASLEQMAGHKGATRSGEFGQLVFDERPGAPIDLATRRHTAASAKAATGEHAPAVFEPFILGQHGGAVARPAHQPLPTIATDAFIRLFVPYLTPIGDKDGSPDPRPILVDAAGRRWRFDLLLRPFEVPELASGQGFAPTYSFAGTKSDAKRMIGNAVSVDVADFLVTAAFYDQIEAQCWTSSLSDLLVAGAAWQSVLEGFPQSA
jgi:site-specific DNA-cytosine methylase